MTRKFHKTWSKGVSSLYPDILVFVEKRYFIGHHFLSCGSLIYLRLQSKETFVWQNDFLLFSNLLNDVMITVYENLYFITEIIFSE